MWSRKYLSFRNTRVHPFVAPAFTHVFIWLSWIRVVVIVKLHVLRCLVPCCDVRYDIPIKRCPIRLDFRLVLCFVNVIWLSSHILAQQDFHDFREVCVARSLIFCLMFCKDKSYFCFFLLFLLIVFLRFCCVLFFVFFCVFLLCLFFILLCFVLFVLCFWWYPFAFGH